jgi:PAS domain S-box-containing protein
MILDAQRCIVQINDRFRELFGYRIEELRGKIPAVMVPPGREFEFEGSIDLLSRGGIYHNDTVRLRRDGTPLEVLVSSQPIASGRFRGGLVVMYQDMTEVKRNARYHDLRLEVSRILGTANTAEQAANELLPQLSETLGWDVVRFWQVRENGLECVGSHTRSGSPTIEAKCTVRASQVVHDGQSVWLGNSHPLESCATKAHCKLEHGSLAAFPIMDTQKRVLGVLELLGPNKELPEAAQRELLEGLCVYLGQFITRCTAEMALAENEAKFRTLAELAPTAIFIHADGVVLYANAAFESIFGYSRDEIVNHLIWPLFHPEVRDEVRERAMLRQSGEKIKKRYEARMVSKNGKLLWVDYSAARITLGNRPAVICAASDITKRRALELQLRQTQKMEAIGRLAGGIAHDFNNLLMVIGCCSESISLGEDLPEDVRRGADEISHAADRAAALTRQLLTFSRHQVLTPRIVDLNSVLTGTELILRRALGDDIMLRFDLEPGLGTILADPSQLEQVVMNLAVNSRDAMPDGGNLSISTSCVCLDDAVRSRPGSYAVLTVADNGIGIDPKFQQHIFEPFFTTKGASKGTGLGLSTVYGIAEQSGGFVTVDSQPNCGATFKVYFPIAGELSEAVEGTENQEIRTACCATILLVEDEEAVRAVIQQSLVRDGHIVLEAADGARALEVSAAFKGKIDLLVTDVVMSGMSGREVADCVVQARPGLKVLYVSGYNEDTVLQKGVIGGEVELLQKPFSPSVLCRKVRQILSR